MEIEVDYVPIDQQTRFCAECGHAFTPTHGPQRYCSAECAKKNRRRFVRNYQRAKRVFLIRQRVCEWCGRSFRSSKHTLCKDCRRSDVAANALRDLRRERAEAREKRRVELARIDAHCRTLDTKVEVVCVNGVRVERRGTVPAGGRAVQLVTHNS